MTKIMFRIVSKYMALIYAVLILVLIIGLLLGGCSASQHTPRYQSSKPVYHYE